jgi:hypothetical protein
MDATGYADFTITFPIFNLLPTLLTATATDPFGSTSEFSPCLEIGSAPPQYSLSILHPNSAPLIVWPGSASAFILEWTPSLSPPVLWNAISNGIVMAGTNRTYAVTNSTTFSNQFFRLRRP